MIPEIRQFFERHIGRAGAGVPDEARCMQLAAAALLEEAVHGELVCEEMEVDEVHLAIGQAFDLPREQLEAVIELTELEARQDEFCCEFGDLIRDHFGRDHKARLAEMLWLAVYAGDGRVDEFERDLVVKAASMAGIQDEELRAAFAQVAGTRH